MTISMPSVQPSSSLPRRARVKAALAEPDAASSRGAWHKPTPSPLHVAILAVAASALVGLCSGCTDDGGHAGSDPASYDTPRSDVPAPLAGEWFIGSLSTIQYYDSDSREFQDPAGVGLFFVFPPHSSHQPGAVITTNAGGCQSRLLGDESGTLTVDGSHLTVYRDHVTVEVLSQCGGDGTRTQGAETRELTWSVRRDESNVEWLELTHTDGSVETYRRWE